MIIKKFEEIKSWQKAQKLAVDIYKTLKDSKEWAYKDQIFRSSISISSNIAEGYERKSNKEFIRFLNIANGSNSEVKSLLYIGVEIGIFTKLEFDNFFLETEEIGMLINGFIKVLK